ncbi:exopolyphosphatase/guanosine-5'-triphosphate,3'-diphosphate pyrophosphatase [Tahibacter aquaticus]|uniref:Exopolyphosphatase/guanosine-5'-triphosphate, 3'-diphosphate pyrophosphatase n=1 Tax=Tahibacter aquaticus TaxID=520092 RepID=A0A4R6YX83_9GAMM|nr:Ppx/GppA phosphatase family protein [Tahibacter aquaticus]TDR43272.1 exopolyphosphatase/guanosine-5'-triphosphate,3'-diphosphate pyrophosphatase [Tahibacter aquaticus]
MPNGQKPIQDGELLAAVDLGSNSFHMVVARYQHGELRVIDRLRDSVRMAAGLNRDGSLDSARRDRALACLARFGQRLRALPPGRVRAVATNTVRRMSVPHAFLLPAETALGHPIEVVSGREEARLIYLGVAHGLPESRERRLCIDIGGGSTEFIIGAGMEAVQTESLQMGCVASTLRFFDDGKLTAKRWRQAQTEIGVELQQFAADYRAHGWGETIGSSGTIRAIGNVVQANGWSDGGITVSSLERLRDALLTAGSIDKIRLLGLSEERQSVIAGGVAILEAAFFALGLLQMQVCETAMREGLLYDLIGRAEQRDPRTASVEALMRRYDVDRAQARRVEATAQLLFDQAADAWHLDADALDWLRWAARIHEIGLAIAHSQHHVHGAYLVRHSDLAGFTRQEQDFLATVLRCHRRKPDQEALAALPDRSRRTAARITALLRLAVLLHRARSADRLPALSVRADERSLELKLGREWLEQHPLTVTDLDQEREYLKDLGVKLQLRAAEKF